MDRGRREKRERKKNTALYLPFFMSVTYCTDLDNETVVRSVNVTVNRSF